MSELRLSVRCDIKDGRLEDFKKVAAACLQTVRTKDTRTLQYEWFLNEDETKCIMLERYDSSDALLEHLANLGETFGELLDTCVMKVDLFGTPSAELLEATEAIPRRIYTFYQGT
ncbi:MAG: antibiotic biosynthesis monooxygenase [marine benthic group bacterium]|jgi:quinol monooxygenase YgiN|nr:antibiotic biosynthesis monooxygenase [Gemmatimonadota bacterium]MCL7961936.1 antibiotic biosynthesis monooxygenase [Candidatus Carthagonibacter metallireducens]MCL7956532.1 antibiotic biosynthesis monooxygenase [Gemmatimonadota bacterium]MCL7964572.1 antibiotic biosynthesis monooxygenase [Gemmatimonadota bacterium]MCL7967389.1 antibiotic biosynthesis monooxygenase [Gemmatimonadota bacterium]